MRGPVPPVRLRSCCHVWYFELIECLVGHLQPRPVVKNPMEIKNTNPKKRPISAVADNIEVRNAKSILIKINKKIKFNLLYDSNRSLQKKI